MRSPKVAKQAGQWEQNKLVAFNLWRQLECAYARYRIGEISLLARLVACPSESQVGSSCKKLAATSCRQLGFPSRNWCKILTLIRVSRLGTDLENWSHLLGSSSETRASRSSHDNRDLFAASVINAANCSAKASPRLMANKWRASFPVTKQTRPTKSTSES